MRKQVPEKFLIAAKCAPERRYLRAICDAGLAAVELYLSVRFFKGGIRHIVKLCREFPLAYALHAPNDGYEPGALRDLADALDVRAVTVHNIFWEEEWGRINDRFKGSSAKLCIENITSVYDAVKFMRRYGLGRCLDVEHFQIEIAGFFEEEFMRLVRESSHIHLTGYYYGSNLWHTHIQQSPAHAAYILDCISRSGYRGFVVSEAKMALQTPRDFAMLAEFSRSWRKQIKEIHAPAASC